MSHATGPAPKLPKKPKRRSPSFRLKVWHCGLCNARCPTVLAAGGLCSVCRRQPSLPGVNDLPGHTDEGGEW
jgi:hypothetical protein